MRKWRLILVIGVAASALRAAAIPVFAQDGLSTAAASTAAATAATTTETMPAATDESDSKERGMKPKTETEAQPVATARKRQIPSVLTDFAEDQKDLWTSPARLRFSDTTWLVPIAGLTAGLFVTDAEHSKHLSNNPTTLQHYSTLSNAGIAGLAGGAAAMWLLSKRTHNEHWRETGFLAADAAVHSLVMSESLKYSLGRQRPLQGDGSGPFFQGGTSFPSEHSAAAWSIAGVIAHEYPGPLTKVLVYGAAAMISFSRVRAKDHFPSDVVVGALIGELSAHQVYTRHHDAELGGETWDSWSDRARWRAEEARVANLGSPYVPLDSWIYPALERLMGMGMIDSGFLGLRPWTRRECARLLIEAGDRAADDSTAGAIYNRLQEEFHAELEPPTSQPRAELESIYTRVTEISDAPVQGYDFGQTIINDFGRPYAQGFNSISGFSFWTTAGSWVGYVRGEYQSAPSTPALPLAAREFMTTSQFLGVKGPFPDTPTPATSQFSLIDAYVGLNLSNWQITFGPQSLWWGPGEGGSMLMSTNAAPIPMFRVNRVTPFTLPLISRFLGPMRVEIFFGQLSGQNFVNTPTGIIGSYTAVLPDQPFINGQKISFKPTANFEFSVSRTGLMAGQGVPFTLGTLRQNILSSGGVPGTAQDPGDRRTAIDWNYRLPKLRRWLSFYGDAFSDDQISPIAYMDRSAITSGLYLSQVPKVPKLDFRVEGVYTDVPAGGALSHGFFYFNARYLNGYTNNGNLIGSWIGREGQGAQAWTNYWFTPRTRLQLNFRHQKVSQQFVPGGGSLTDFGVRSDFSLRPSVSVTVSLQRERWLFPILRPGVTHDFSSSIGIVFEPHKLFRSAKSDDDVVSPGGGRP
jgi:membrane-associated phospholipid phosphatase